MGESNYFYIIINSSRILLLTADKDFNVSAYYLIRGEEKKILIENYHGDL